MCFEAGKKFEPRDPGCEVVGKGPFVHREVVPDVREGLLVDGECVAAFGYTFDA